MVFGVHIFDLDLGFQIDSVKLPTKSNSVGPGHVSHRRISSLIIILIKASLSSHVQLRHVFEKNVCLWVHNPHHQIDQPSVFF